MCDWHELSSSFQAEKRNGGDVTITHFSQESGDTSILLKTSSGGMIKPAYLKPSKDVAFFSGGKSHK